MMLIVITFENFFNTSQLLSGSIEKGGKDIPRQALCCICLPRRTDCKSVLLVLPSISAVANLY